MLVSLSVRCNYSEPVIAEGKGVRGPISGSGSSERHIVTALEVHPCFSGMVAGNGQGSEDSFPRDEHRRHYPRAGGLAVNPQRLSDVAGLFDRRTQRRADAEQRLGRYTDALAQAVDVAGVNAHRSRERSESLQLRFSHRAGRIRIAWPPPGASLTRSRVAEVTALFVMLTGRGLSSQFASGPSA